MSFRKRVKVYKLYAVMVKIWKGFYNPYNFSLESNTFMIDIERTGNDIASLEGFIRFDKNTGDTDIL